MPTTLHEIILRHFFRRSFLAFDGAADGLRAHAKLRSDFYHRVREAWSTSVPTNGHELIISAQKVLILDSTQEVYGSVRVHVVATHFAFAEVTFGEKLRRYFAYHAVIALWKPE